MTTPIKKYLLLGLISLTSSFPTWAADTPNTVSTQPAKVTLKVGYLPVLDHLPLLVSQAHDNETFQHIHIESKMFKSWDEMVGAIKANVVEAAFILSPLAMDLFNQGLAIQTILLAHRGGSAITVKHDLPIQTAIDLKGKAIAIPYRKSTHTALLNYYLGQHGLSLADVITKVIAPPNMQPAMQQGSIDAFIVAEPYGSKAQLDGVGKTLVLTKDLIPHHVECIVVVKRDVLTKYPAAIQEWVASLIRAGQWIEQDKTKGSHQVAELTAKKSLPHSATMIINSLQHPTDRISYADLNPVVADFQTIVDISKQANILEDVNLKAFINDHFYRQAQTQEK